MEDSSATTWRDTGILRRSCYRKSPYSVCKLSSGCLASLWGVSSASNYVHTHGYSCGHPDLVFLELGFLAHSLGKEFIWIWTSPRIKTEASPVSLVWTHCEAEASSLPAAPEGLCSWPSWHGPWILVLWFLCFKVLSPLMKMRDRGPGSDGRNSEKRRYPRPSVKAITFKDPVPTTLVAPVTTF